MCDKSIAFCDLDPSHSVKKKRKNSLIINWRENIKLQTFLKWYLIGIDNL